MATLFSQYATLELLLLERRAQRVPAEKTSKLRPNELMEKNEDRDTVILYLPY
jgi:hypothetical protein